MYWAERARHCIAAVAVSCLAMFGGRTEACMVCIPFPQNTISDDLLSAKVVVLARENPKKPFSYVAIELLKGNLDLPEIDLFLNSSIRRRLVPADHLRAFLADPQYIEWRALYILLLGVDAKPDEKDAIRAAMERRVNSNQTLNLSAWATALIEIDGEEAIDWLEAHYLSTPDRNPEVVLEIVKALSVHGARKRSGLRERVAESYAALIQTHPSLVGWAARDLTGWSDWRFADALEELRENLCLANC